MYRIHHTYQQSSSAAPPPKEPYPISFSLPITFTFSNYRVSIVGKMFFLFLALYSEITSGSAQRTIGGARQLKEDLQHSILSLQYYMQLFFTKTLTDENSKQ